jgi:hypothetical protein
MSYEEVVRILGSEGVREIAGLGKVRYKWNIGLVIIMFEDGKVTDKSQVGLE